MVVNRIKLMSSVLEFYKVKKGTKVEKITNKNCWGMVRRPYNCLEAISEVNPSFYEDCKIMKIDEELFNQFLQSMVSYEPIDLDRMSYDEVIEYKGMKEIAKKYNRYSPYTFWEKYDIYVYRC